MYCQRCKSNLIAGKQTTVSTKREPSTQCALSHRWHADNLIANAGALNLIADIANFDFAGLAGKHGLHHDGGIAKYRLEARSTTASYSIVNFADFAGAAAKVGNS